MSALELIGVTKEHQGSPPVAALRSVTVTIRAGELAAIVGPSGSGKSTMLAIAGTLERPTAGSVRVACAVLILAGLVLLMAELKPARVSRLATDPAQAGADGIDTAYTRRGLAAAIRSGVTGVDGVRGASVKVKRRKIKVAATAAAQDKAAARILRDPVLAAARQRLAALKLHRAPSVSVRVTPRSR